MIQLMKQLDWNRIAVIYEDNLYCQYCIQSLVKQAQQNLICVSKQLAINVSNDGDVSIDQINAFSRWNHAAVSYNRWSSFVCR